MGGGGGQKIAKKCHLLFEWPLTPDTTEYVTALDWRRKIIIFESILTTFEASTIF